MLAAWCTTSARCTSRRTWRGRHRAHARLPELPAPVVHPMWASCCCSSSPTTRRRWRVTWPSTTSARCSGYPTACTRPALCARRQLAITEGPWHPAQRLPRLARASVALRVVPGEFDLAFVGPISAAAGSTATAKLATPARSACGCSLLDAALQTGTTGIVALASTAQSQALMDALDLAQHLLARLRKGWNRAACGATAKWPCRRGGNERWSRSALPPARHPQRDPAACRQAAGR